MNKMPTLTFKLESIFLFNESTEMNKSFCAHTCVCPRHTSVWPMHTCVWPTHTSVCPTHTCVYPTHTYLWTTQACVCPTHTWVCPTQLIWQLFKSKGSFILVLSKKFPLLGPVSTENPDNKFLRNRFNSLRDETYTKTYKQDLRWRIFYALYAQNA